MVGRVEDILSSVGEWVMNIDKPCKALIVYITVPYKPGYSTGIITLHILYSAHNYDDVCRV